MKVAIIGVGNMGSAYAMMIQNGEIKGIELAALTGIGEKYREKLHPAIMQGIPVFDSDDDFFDAIDKGLITADAAIVATPHYRHEQEVIRALKAGMHVLLEKPAGVCSKQARLMAETAQKTGKVFGMVFNQRTYPVYKQLKQIVDEKKYGELKRVSWVATNWYRPDAYYETSSWRGKWNTDGGGVLLNQCSHNLDILQWILGMPEHVQAFCHEGRYHNIEVEDDATVYMEWANGATGTFVTSTGEVPGENRLEMVFENAKILCDGRTIKIGEVVPELKMSESENRKTSQDFFKAVNGSWTTLRFPVPRNQYRKTLRAFFNECSGKGKCIADGAEGRKSLIISNAAYLSSWEKCMVRIPKLESLGEVEFEKDFEHMLRIKNKEQ